MQILADQTKRVLLHGLTFGPAKMRHQDGFRAVLAQVVDGRQSLPDSRVISDTNFAAAGFDWYIKVHSHQHGFSAHIQITH